MTLTVAALSLLAAAGVAVSERAMPPQTLVVGYENEGKIDASDQACVAHVKEVTLVVYSPPAHARPGPALPRNVARALVSSPKMPRHSAPRCEALTPHLERYV